jgi:hypothetical protein
MPARPSIARFAASALACLALAGCSQNSFTRQTFALNASDIVVCCDDQDALPAQVGEFQVLLFQGPLLPFEGRGLEITFTQVGDSTPVRLSLASGSNLDIGSTTVDVFVDDCDFRAAQVRFRVDVTGRTADGRTEVITQEGAFTVVNSCPPPPYGNVTPQRVLEEILDAPIPSGLSLLAAGDPIGVPTQNPNTMVSPSVPADGFAEIFETGAVVVQLSGDRVIELFSGSSAVDPVFPEGQGSLGFTILPEQANTPPTGRWLIAWQALTASVPLDSPDRFLEYSLFVDRDNDAMNNFMAPAPFDSAAVDDTDQWYQAIDTPTGGWRLLVTDGRDSMPMARSSAARVVIADRIVFFMIPTSEFSFALQTLPLRYQAFSHFGDFGQAGGAFSIDVVPPTDENRIAQSLQLTSF